MTLFKYDSLRTAAWCLLAIRVVMTIANHGNILALNTFHGQTNASILTSGVLELFGYIVSAYCTLNFRRKNVLKTTYVIIGVVYLSMYLLGLRVSEIDIDTTHGIVIFILIVGRLAVCVGYATILLYIVEVMPTTLRHHAHGLYSAVTYFVLIFLEGAVVSLRAGGFHPQFWLGLIFIFLWQVMTYIPETQTIDLLDQIKEEDVYLMNTEMVLR